MKKVTVVDRIDVKSKIAAVTTENYLHILVTCHSLHAFAHAIAIVIQSVHSSMSLSQW